MLAEGPAADLARARDGNPRLAGDLAQALFDHDSAASHADPHLRSIAWNREHAVLALGTAASLAQVIFAHS